MSLVCKLSILSDFKYLPSLLFTTPFGFEYGAGFSFFIRIVNGIYSIYAVYSPGYCASFILIACDKVTVVICKKKNIVLSNPKCKCREVMVPSGATDNIQLKSQNLSVNVNNIVFCRVILFLVLLNILNV